MSLCTGLGSGTIGTVYRATDIKGGHVLAARRISLDTKKDISPTAIKALYDLPWVHKNIVLVFKVLWNTNNLWMFMEYCENQNLEKYFRKCSQGLNFKIRLSAMKQITLAIDFLHKLNIKHTDVKPQNVLVSSGDDMARVTFKLADFGMKCYVKPNYADWAELDLLFHSPKVWKNFQDGKYPLDRYGTRDDLFSLGLLFLAILEAQVGKPLVPAPDSPSLRYIGLEVHKQLYSEDQEQEKVMIAQINVGDDEVSKCIKQLIQCLVSTHTSEQPFINRVLDILTHDEEQI